MLSLAQTNTFFSFFWTRRAMQRFFLKTLTGRIFLGEQTRHEAYPAVIIEQTTTRPLENFLNSPILCAGKPPLDCGDELSNGPSTKRPSPKCANGIEKPRKKPRTIGNPPCFATEPREIPLEDPGEVTLRSSLEAEFDECVEYCKRTISALREENAALKKNILALNQFSSIVGVLRPATV